MRHLQLPRDYPHNPPVRLCRSAAGIHHHHSLRLPFRNLQVSFPHSREKGARLLLEAVFVALTTACGSRSALIAAAGSTDDAGGIGIQQDCQVWLQGAAEHTMQFEHWVTTQLSAAAL